MKKRYRFKKNSEAFASPSEEGEKAGSADISSSPEKGDKFGANGADDKGRRGGKRKRARRAIAIALAVVVGLPVLATLIAAGAYAIWAKGVTLDSSLLPTSSALPRFYDSEGEALAYKQDSYITAEDIPSRLKNAFIAVEDKRFYSHHGYDVWRMMGAAVRNLAAGKVKEGASTITQQLVKNTQLTSERTVKRKLTEIALAAKLEKQYSKDEILSMYLSVIYFGSGAYGVRQAAHKFFGKEINELTLAECATLAGIVKNPAGYSPLSKPDSCIKRRNTVLELMREQGYIDEAEFAEATAAALTAYDGESEGADACALYVEEAAKQVCEALDMTRFQLDNSGLKIYTALDRKLCEALCELNGSCVSGEGVDSASIVLDSDGYVLALSSTLPYIARRQAGSVLKPLAVYAPALDRGLISLATPVTDERVDYGGYSPSNFGGIYYGDTTIKQAISRSMNSVSVKVMDYLGADMSVEYLRRFGIPVADEDKNYALALGALTKGVTVGEIAAAYCALASGGARQDGKFVKCVIDGDKYALNSKDDNPEGARVISPAASTLTSIALLDAVQNGTAKTLSALPFEVAAKTGTAERKDGSNSDCWCASYNDSFTVVVWHGSDDGTSERGGGYPTMHAQKIWRELAEFCDMPAKIEIDGSVTPIEIDSRSSAKSKHVVAATPNTPRQYVTTEYFDATRLPTAEGSLFERISPPELRLTVMGGIVRLSFECSGIYDYQLVREDSLGAREIFSGSGDGTKTVYDSPTSLGGRVRYTLTCSVGDETASTSKEAYVSAPFMLGASG